MHLTGIKLGGIPPFTEPITLRFDERVNVFIGPNASGKSTLLREIYEHRRLRHLDSKEVEVTRSQDWPKNEVPFISIPATRVNLPPKPLDWSKQPPIGIEEFEDSMEAWEEGVSRVFDGAWVELAVEIFNTDRDEQFGKAVMLGYECTRTICSDLVQDYAPHPFVERRGWEDDVEIIVHPGMGIGTIDDSLLDAPVEPLYAGQLSSGTQGTYLWLLHVSLKMAYHYRFKRGWHEEPAILLIDEIENHLHPTWQRRVIPALLDHFPGLQILATTHSPFVVAGLKAGQVHVLKRDANGVVTASTNERDVVGWTMDEVLRTLMGVEDPTDDETAKAANELRQLRNKGLSIVPEEEEERQKRIQELRQKVDRDLLAGGPEAAQRELFEQQFAQALEKYRQSQDLEQENH